MLENNLVKVNKVLFDTTDVVQMSHDIKFMSNLKKYIDE